MNAGWAVGVTGVFGARSGANGPITQGLLAAQGRDQKALAAVRTRRRIESAAADLYNVKRRKLEAKAEALRETTTKN